jgi:uncharacterized membrane protein
MFGNTRTVPQVVAWVALALILGGTVALVAGLGGPVSGASAFEVWTSDHGPVAAMAPFGVRQVTDTGADQLHEEPRVSASKRPALSLASNRPTVEWLLTLCAFLLSMLGAALLLYDRFGTDRRANANAEQSPDEPDHGSRTESVSDEERVRTLLQEHGGEMRQKQIVERVDWSKAKVSRVLSRLEEEGQVVKVRLGRENVIYLPGHEQVVSDD